MGSLVITRRTRDGENSIIIDEKLRLTLRKASGSTARLQFQDITEERVKVRREEVPYSGEYKLRKVKRNEKTK